MIEAARWIECCSDTRALQHSTHPFGEFRRAWSAVMDLISVLRKAAVVVKHWGTGVAHDGAVPLLPGPRNHHYRFRCPAHELRQPLQPCFQFAVGIITPAFHPWPW